MAHIPVPSCMCSIYFLFIFLYCFVSISSSSEDSFTVCEGVPGMLCIVMVYLLHIVYSMIRYTT